MMRRIFCVALFLMLGVTATVMQWHIFMHDDVIFNLHATREWLAGGTYTNDFLDPSPPLIILLSAPAVWFAKWIDVNVMYVFDVCIEFFSLASLAVSVFLLRKILKDPVLFAALTIAMVFVLFFFPYTTFGQREHLWVVFTLPYLMLIMVRLCNRPIKRLPAVIIGFFAGIGFALKPFFLITYVLLELLFIFKRKSARAFFRAESLGVIVMILAYVSLIYLFFPDYIRTIVPLIQKYYLMTVWQPMILNLFFLYSIILLGLYGAEWRRWTAPVVSQVLMVASLGGLLAFFAAHRASFIYYAFSTVSFSILLGALFLGELIKRFFGNHWEVADILRMILVLSIAILASQFMLYDQQLTYLGVFSFRLPMTFFGIVLMLFFAVALKKIIKEPVTRFFLLLTFAVMFFFVMMQDSVYVKPASAVFKMSEILFCVFVCLWHFAARHRVRYPVMNNSLFAISVGLFLFALLVNHDRNFMPLADMVAALLLVLIVSDGLIERFPYASATLAFRKIIGALAIGFAAILLLLVPMMMLAGGIRYCREDLKNGPLPILVDYLSAYPKATFDYLLLSDELLSLEMDYHHPFVGKYAELWWYNAVKNSFYHPKSEAAADAKFLIEGFANKLNQAQPQFVITAAPRVDLQSDPFLKSDIVKIFSQNERFKQAWTHYRVKTFIGKTYVVYERV